ncbi:MAG: hypothetical protein ABEJ77_05110 [Halanaeroarchaeum sp.]
MSEGTPGPIASVRALLLVGPLGVLVGAVLAPPDPFSQAAVIAVATGAGWLVARRFVDVAALDARRLGAFYVVVTLVVVLGLLALGRLLRAGPTVDLLARALVVALAVTAGQVLVLGRG